MAIRTRTIPILLALAASVGCTADAPGPTAPASIDASALATRAAPFATGLVSVEWQAQARSLVGLNRQSPLAAGRVYAALSVAQNWAMEAADAELPAVQVDGGEGFGPGGRSLYELRRGAVAGASRRVLGWFYASAATTLEQMEVADGEAGPGDTHPQFLRGLEIGRAAGDAMVARLTSDRFTAPWMGPVHTGAGIWVPNVLPPAGGTLGNVVPYFLTTGSQFRPPPPPDYLSAAFAADLQEVVALTNARTTTQTAWVRSWDYAGGTPTPVGYWDAKAASLVTAHDLDERAATEVFAMTQAAIFDALIGCWEAKYEYWLYRPYQANGAVALALPPPNHPSYPSGHSCVSASAARVLAHYFPAHQAELEALVLDAGESRIVGGLHYRFDITAGQELGRRVADWALAQGTP